MRSSVLRPLPISPGSSLLSNYISFSFWLHWVFVAVCRLSLIAASGGYSSLRCSGFPLWRLLSLWSMGSRHTGFSSCGSQALVGSLYSVVLGLAAPRHVESSQTRVLSTSGFLSIAPPGKSLFLIFSRNLHTILHYGCPNLHSHEQYTRFLFLYVLSHTCYLLFFDKKPF